MTEIFGYLDYRKYLADMYTEKKNSDRSFSFRLFAKRAGFASPNFLQLVMQGKRNLSQQGIMKCLQALKLKKAEAEFFENLVRFNQSKTDEERNFYYTRIAANKQYTEIKVLEKAQFEYYSKWYHVAVREMVLLKSFVPQPAWIAAHLQPQISEHEAAESLHLLEQLGLLVRNKAGQLTQQDRYVDSGDEVTSLAVANFHREMLNRAAEAIDGQSAKNREISAVTFAVSETRLREAKKMIQEFRKKISQFLSEEDAAEQVCQLNMQFFQLTSKIGEQV